MKSAKCQSSTPWFSAAAAVLLAVLAGCKSGGKKERATASLSPEQSHQAMLEQLAEIADSAAKDNSYFGGSRREHLLAQANPAGDKASPGLLLDLAIAELTLGNEKASIEHLEKAAARVKAGGRPSRSDVLYWLGVAYLRLAETENCCARNTPDSCILPIRGGGIHSDENGSRQAIRCFTEVLQTTPRRSETHVRARWLLNLACMTLGEYPGGVPAQYRVDPSYFESKIRFPRFKNTARQLGLDTFSCAGGVIIDDFDNDGDFDVVVSDSDPGVRREFPLCVSRGALGAGGCARGGQLRYYENTGKEGFVDRTDAANLTGLLGGLNMMQTDFNNDGRLDIFVVRGGWFKSEGRHPNSLLQNNGDGTFTDVTLRAGLAELNQPTQTASWADYDLDGDLDLYVGNERHSHDPPSQLFRNNGDGTFTDVARAAGVTNDRFAKAVIWGDYNGDRRPDLYVSNFGAPNRLYHNNGDGTFTDVAPKLGVTGPEVSFACWFWDFDNDGRLDLYVTSYAAHMDDVAADAMDFPLQIERAKLYRNTGDGFEDVAERMGVTAPASPMGANFGDINGDGYLDFYLGTGWPDYDELMPNKMYVSRAGQGFDDVTMAGGFGHLQKGHGIVFVDLDQDGDQDVFEEMGGAVLGDGYFNAFFENPGFGNNWISVKLTGTSTNRAAVGARIRIDLDEAGGTRSIYRTINSGGTFGANPFEKNIGLGKADHIKLLEIEWPVSGTKQQFRNLGVNRRIVITEGEATVKPAPR